MRNPAICPRVTKSLPQLLAERITLGDACGFEPVGGVLVNQPVVVNEQVPTAVVDVVKGAHEKDRHLTRVTRSSGQ